MACPGYMSPPLLSGKHWTPEQRKMLDDARSIAPQEFQTPKPFKPAQPQKQIVTK